MQQLLREVESLKSDVDQERSLRAAAKKELKKVLFREIVTKNLNEELVKVRQELDRCKQMKTSLQCQFEFK